MFSLRHLDVSMNRDRNWTCMWVILRKVQKLLVVISILTSSVNVATGKSFSCSFHSIISDFLLQISIFKCLQSSCIPCYIPSSRKKIVSQFSLIFSMDCSQIWSLLYSFRCIFYTSHFISFHACAYLLFLLRHLVIEV